MNDLKMCLQKTVKFLVLDGKAVNFFAGFALMACVAHSAHAVEPNESTSVNQSENTATTVDVNLPKQPLDVSLKEFARTSGVSLSFDSALASGKTAPAVQGRMGKKEALQKLLSGSGLEVNVTGNNAIIKSSGKDAVDVQLKPVQVRAKRYKQVGPLPGLSLTKEQIAGNIQSISAKEIKEAHSLSLSDLLNSKLQSVNVNDYQGNPFQMDVTYRGFTAGPQIGTPQGLSIFFDGIRVNEPFGDVVNWDMIPMNALDSFDVFPGSNPLFGLNTLGGALSMKTKSGFTSPGVSAEILTGSYGRKQLQASGGINNASKDEGSWDAGDFAAFGAVNLFMEDGWRKNSPSKVNQAFGKLEWQGERSSLAFSTLGVSNKLVGNGTIPQEFYREDPSSVFTSPDKTDNTLLQFQLSGAFDFTDNFNMTGMVYQRNSNRHANTGDIIDTESFQETLGDSAAHYGTRLPGKEKGITCGYADANGDGIPNYYKITEAKYFDFLLSTLTPTGADYTLTEGLNAEISDELTTALKKAFTVPVHDPFLTTFYTQGTAGLPFGVFGPEFFNFPNNQGIPFVEDDGSTSYVIAADALNKDTCLTDQYGGPANIAKGVGWNQWTIPGSPKKTRDGIYDAGSGPGSGSGVIEGTPTAIITDTNIKQTTKGATVQLNWNYDEHKFMIGTSIDKSYASYVGKQRLGLLDNNRNVYSDASQLGEEYYYADHDAIINDFAGTSSTRSAYFSETWTPTEVLNLSFSGRYNYTNVVNKLAPTKADRNLVGIRALNRYPFAIICPGNDLSNCPYSIDGPIPADVYKDLLNNRVGTDPINLLDKSATEKFSFHSLNPALGVTWQAKPNLNMYANWNQGTRTPSVIELGCAYDGTLVVARDENGNITGDGIARPRSLVEGRGCKLPSSLSGDPYLPQVVAQTIEVGGRGKFNDFIEWNISAYRTNVKDDIYLTSIGNDLSFFQSIGDTRRQGIEFGMAGEYGKSDFRINYSLTEATFQSFFKTFSSANSTRGLSGQFLNQIQVQPGNVMPGVPFNNFNFNWGYKLTPNLKTNWTLVAHSGSFLRGNENNAHVPTPSRFTSSGSGQTLPNEYSGRVPGYAVINFNSHYDIGKGWGATVLVNNVLDKKYFTAGRLGTNPFAPSTLGAIGPGGFNYNSNEWISSQFISPAAPRGVWVALSYDFDASKKSVPVASSAADIEPDRPELPANKTQTAQELALAKTIDGVKALPVLSTSKKQASLATQSAEQKVKENVEAWRKALAENNADALVKSYNDSFAPTGSSHVVWKEQQKLRLISDVVKTAEVSDLVVAPQGLRMVAVFTHRLNTTQQQQTTRKVLTFEQKEGEWLIIRESSLPSKSAASEVFIKQKQSKFELEPQDNVNKFQSDKVKTSHESNIKTQPLKLTKTDRLAQVEIK